MKVKKKICAALLCLLTLFCLFACNGAEEEGSDYVLKKRVTGDGYYRFYLDGDKNLPDGTYAVMTVATSDGLKEELTVMLLAKYAPKTVENFIAYAESGFYDGTVFHRVAKEYCVLQGGGFEYKDNVYTEKGNKRNPIIGEFANNGFPENIIAHAAGAISMARTNEVNSATSQFFFSWEAYPSWDGEYAAFGFLVYDKDIEFIKKLGTETRVDAGERPSSRTITLESVRIVRVPSEA